MKTPTSLQCRWSSGYYLQLRLEPGLQRLRLAHAVDVDAPGVDRHLEQPRRHQPRAAGGCAVERPHVRTAPGIVDHQQAAAVLEDDDFVQSRLVRGRPRLLWLIDTGNVDNRTLEALVRHEMPQVERAFEGGGFVELGLFFADWRRGVKSEDPDFCESLLVEAH